MTATLAGGFGDPALGAQATFRTILDAMAHPGRIETLPLGTPQPPAPLHAGSFALALALIDFETPIWLDAALATDAVISNLRFHCGCGVVDDPARASFALIGEPSVAPPLAAFDQGTPEYPDRATTLVLQVGGLRAGPGVRLTGPGIRTEARLEVDGLAGDFWRQWAENRQQFPQGVDVIFSGGDRLAALPRGIEAEHPACT